MGIILPEGTCGLTGILKIASPTASRLLTLALKKKKKS